ncbi:MAG: hypothetical protein ABJF10_28025 [Chthoniobacter sp.]|uniref:hypothetical protein n=1 Tax=Chthoniobacter sp. TaxID=2510640 RepID=UPI0032A873A9
MNRPTTFRIAALCGAACALPFSACEKPQIRVYTITKNAPAATPPPGERPLQLSDAQAKSATKTAPKASRPKLDYQLPPGWQDAGPSEFSLVNFRIPTPKGDAMVNITPLAGMKGKDTVIVNMWRQQVDQPPLEEPAAAASLTPVDIGGEQGKLFEVTGARDGQTLQIITAFVHRDDGSWFYKLQGSAEAVASQKEAFLNFLKTVKIKPGTAETAAAAPAPSPTPPPPASEPTLGLHMMTPEGWQEQPAGQMQVAKFSVAKEGGKADVSVSVFSSDTGGTLANVNRWRRQLGLEDVDEAGLQECATTLGGAHIDGAPGPMLADLSKDNRRLLGAIVPREGQWWFYKMVGDAPVVNAEHDTFVQFVKSQP